MARTRKTSREALDEKIEKAEADVIAAKKRYDHAKKYDPFWRGRQSASVYADISVYLGGSVEKEWRKTSYFRL